MKRIIIISIFLVITLSAGCTRDSRPQAESQPAGITYAGVRSSSYGINPFPSPQGWGKAIGAMNGYFENSQPCAVWIVGVLDKPDSCRLEFPADGKEYPHTVFLDIDKHEPYLDYFDQQGIKVFLQVEPAHADVETLIDLVLNRYKHHECVIGMGIDVEWYKEADNPGWGVKVDDPTAEKWEKKVKNHNPAYRLFLKHWDREWMPPAYRGDILFVSDSQMLESRDKMLEEFTGYWADYFKPNPVGFQVGYRSDHHWWGNLETPPRAVGQALAQRIEQECSIFWVDFTLPQVLPTGPGKAGGKPMVGVKIYEYDTDFPDLFKQWPDMGINTAFVSQTLAENKEFMALARQHRIAVFIILPTFYNPEKLKENPDLFAVTGEGKIAKDGWVEFVCPTREEYRKQHLEYIKNIVADCKPTGISIDFIRYFVFWEMVYPDAQLNPLHNTCFCTHCLEKMQTDLGFQIPGGLTEVKQKAEWVLAHHKAAWVAWKCDVITSMVRDIAAEARKAKPGILTNVHIVPWRADDFGGGRRVVAGQDIAAIASHVDYLSPMCYAHMVKRDPAWIGSVVRDMAGLTHKKILPSIQVKKAYLKEDITPEVLKTSIREALKGPSAGVVFWGGAAPFYHLLTPRAFCTIYSTVQNAGR